MPKIKGARPFKRLPNVETLNWIRRNNSTDYRARVPEATSANMEYMVDNIMNYTATRNEFIGTLVNQIGLSRASGVTFANPLKNYKREKLNYGDTFEETYVGLAMAHVYDPDRDYMERILFGRETPETQTAFHKITREEFYKITVDLNLLKRAFNSEYGISDFVNTLMSVPATSDEWDEFLQMSSLFRLAYDRNGFFVRSVPDVNVSSSNADDAKALTRQVRADAGTLQFVSRHYNPAGMPVAVKPEELILFVTPEGQAAIDVEALAGAFNQDKANVQTRVELIPSEHMNIPGVQAILTTESFFVVMDRLYETSSQFNAATLAENHFLHHHEIMSISPFAPAILYSSTDEATVIPTEETPVTSIGNLKAVDLDADNPEAAVTSIERGRLYQILGEGVTNPEGGLNDGVKLALTGAQSNFTRLEQTGTLLVGHDEKAETLTVTATALDNEEVSATLDLTVTGERWGNWPDPGDVGGAPDPEPEARTASTAKASTTSTSTKSAK